MNSSKERTLLFYLIFAATSLITTLPILYSGFWPFAPDADYHGKWFYNFSRHFWAGDIYPRWLEGMNGGLGSPAFFFYPPLPYWITSMIEPFFGSNSTGWRALSVSCCIAVFLSGLGAFYWIKGITRTTYIAVVTAIVYQVAPFHIALDLYERGGAFAEFWGLTWIPWILFAIKRLVYSTGEKVTPPKVTANNFLLLTFFFACLVLTHLPTVLTFSWIALLYSFLNFKLSKPNPTNAPMMHLALALLALAFGACVAGIYVIPAMKLQGLVHIEELLTTDRELDYSENFFTRQTLGRSWFREILFQIACMVAYSLICAALIVAQARALRRSAPSPAKQKDKLETKHHLEEAIFWTVISVIIMLMMFPVSRPVYSAIPKLQFIQYPFRFGVGLCATVSALTAIALRSGNSFGDLYLSATNPGKIRLLPILTYQIVFVFVCLSLWFCIDRSWSVWQPPEDIQLSEGFPDAPEYAPISVNQDWRTTEATFKPGEKINVVTGSCVADVISWNARCIVLNVQTAKGATIDLKRWFFPNLHIEGSDVLLGAAPVSGLVRLTIPPCERPSRLTLRVTALTKEIAGGSITIASVACFLVSFFWIRRGGLLNFPRNKVRPSLQ